MSSSFTKKIIPIFSSSPVYLPLWLSRVPESKLAYASKVLYGFLSNMSDSLGVSRVYGAEFANAIGMSDESLEKQLKELIKVRLIASLLGGAYEFCDHEWMHGKYD